MLTAPSATPVRWSIRDGIAEPDRRDVGRRAARGRRSRARRAARPATSSASAARPSPRSARPTPTTPASIFVPPRSTPMTRVPATRRVPYFAGCRRKKSPIASTEAGAPRARSRCPRARGRVRGAATAAGAATGRVDYRGPGGAPAAAGSRGAGVIAIGIADGAPRSSSSGRSRASSRSAAASTTRTSGSTRARGSRSPSRAGCCSRIRRRSCCSAPTTRRSAGREGDRHSDSIMLVRTDPSKHRIAYLSIPRDLRVPIPGYGDAKINAAFQIGGAPLAIKTITEFTGVDDQPRRDRRLRRLQGPDRRARRDRRRRPDADPLEQVRLPVRDASSAATRGRAGASRRASSTWTAGARSSTRGSARTGSTRARSDSRAARASSA